MKSIEDSIEGWEGKPITSVCNEFLFEVSFNCAFCAAGVC